MKTLKDTLTGQGYFSHILEVKDGQLQGVSCEGFTSYQQCLSELFYPNLTYLFTESAIEPEVLLEDEFSFSISYEGTVLLHASHYDNGEQAVCLKEIHNHTQIVKRFIKVKQVDTRPLDLIKMIDRVLNTSELEPKAMYNTQLLNKWNEALRDTSLITVFDEAVGGKHVEYNNLREALEANMMKESEHMSYVIHYDGLFDSFQLEIYEESQRMQSFYFFVAPKCDVLNKRLTLSEKPKSQAWRLYLQSLTGNEYSNLSEDGYNQIIAKLKAEALDTLDKAIELMPNKIILNDYRHDIDLNQDTFQTLASYKEKLEHIKYVIEL